MHCPTCPPDRHAYCRGQGCQAPSAAPCTADPNAGSDLGLQVKRLDVENGDILVVRSKSRLTPTRAAEIHDQVAALVRRHGYRDVTVMVLDDCSDLTVERPGPILVYKSASVGKSEMLVDPFYWRGEHQPRHTGSNAPSPPTVADPVHPHAYDARFIWEAERVVAYAKATGDYRGVTHDHALAATGHTPFRVSGE